MEDAASEAIYLALDYQGTSLAEHCYMLGHKNYQHDLGCLVEESDEAEETLVAEQEIFLFG